MSKGSSVLLDADFFVGFYLSDDAHHVRSAKLLGRIVERELDPVVTNLVVAETANVLSIKAGQSRAIDFLRELEMNTIFIDESLHKDTSKIFSEQSKKGTSFVDCANVAVMKNFSIPYICAFDQVYHKSFKLENLAYPLENVA